MIMRDGEQWSLGKVTLDVIMEPDDYEELIKRARDRERFSRSGDYNDALTCLHQEIKKYGGKKLEDNDFFQMGKNLLLIEREAELWAGSTIIWALETIYATRQEKVGLDVQQKNLLKEINVLAAAMRNRIVGNEHTEHCYFARGEKP